jgi:hypothetical protein
LVDSPLLKLTSGGHANILPSFDFRLIWCRTDAIGTGDTI